MIYRSFRNGIHRLLRRADASGNADIICPICDSSLYMFVVCSSTIHQNHDFLGF